MTRDDIRGLLVGLFLFLGVLAAWAAAFLYAPVDVNQGQVYRIIYLHVPSAFAAFTAGFVLFVFSIWGLKTRTEAPLRWSKAAAEVGLLFTILTLATGSIWGKPTWGIWWTWDARLTTTFILALLFAGWLLLYASLTPGPGRTTGCAVLGILIFVDVPIIYKSVTWWRTLHQPPSMLRRDGPTMDPEILWTLVASIVITVLYGIWLGWQRGRNLALKDEIEAASYREMRG